MGIFGWTCLRSRVANDKESGKPAAAISSDRPGMEKHTTTVSRHAIFTRLVTVFFLGALVFLAASKDRGAGTNCLDRGGTTGKGGGATEDGSSFSCRENKTRQNQGKVSQNKSKKINQVLPYQKASEICASETGGKTTDTRTVVGGGSWTITRNKLNHSTEVTGIVFPVFVSSTLPSTLSKR